MPCIYCIALPSVAGPVFLSFWPGIFVALHDPVELATTGVYQLPKATAAVLAVGARVAWDNTAKNINVPGTGRFPVGVATEAAGNGITSVAVRLDGVGTVAA